MSIKWLPLGEEKKKELESLHRKERDGRIRDRIKAVLLKDEGWACKEIAQALRIHEESVRQHLFDWFDEQKLKPENGGSFSKLNEEQSKALDKHLSAVTYTKVSDICAYIQAAFNLCYTVSGMTKWLRQNGFRYKKPKLVPLKADLQKQEEFIEKYISLVVDTPKDQPILFMDSAHPTMATKVAYGWIKKGVNKPIEQIASRTRVNIVGAIELKTMKLTSSCPETVNSETIVEFFDKLKATYPNASKLHVIHDQSGYHMSKLVQEEALKRNIILVPLPPYSPNLNSIERVWKVMNEKVRNNRFFKSAKQFREAIDEFLNTTIHKMGESLRSRINDNFQIVKPASSS